MRRRVGFPGPVSVLVLAAAVMLAAAGGPAVAADETVAQKVPGQPHAATGAGLAKKLCANCHLTGTDTEERTSAQVDVPTFKEIAGKEGQTRARIATAIMLPTHPMPTIQLTRDETGDLAEYILSLKQAD